MGHVLVLPGAPWDPGAAGCNQLIRDGATLVRSLTDILEELGATVTGGSVASEGGPGRSHPGRRGRGRSRWWPGAQTWSGLDPPARAVLTALIDGQLLTHGRLAAATTLPPAALDAALLDLELAGLIRRTTAGIQAIGLLGPPAAGGGPAPPSRTAGPSSPCQPAWHRRSSCADSRPVGRPSSLPLPAPIRTTSFREGA